MVRRIESCGTLVIALGIQPENLLIGHRGRADCTGSSGWSACAAAGLRPLPDLA
jgi:hypothetical protein